TKSKLSEPESYEIIAHPVYLELNENKKRYDLKHLELITGFTVTQLKQNTADAILIGRGNLFPTIFVEGNLWVQEWLGLNVAWNRGMLVTLGSQQNPDAPNKALIMPTWLDLIVKFRYTFDKWDGSSYIAFKAGYHSHKFPINTESEFISKNSASGLSLGAQRRFAFNPMYGLDFNFDFLWLTKLQDNSEIPNSQKGIGFRFVLDFYGTIIDNSGLKTLISLGYGQTSYISRLHGDDVSEDSRLYMGANHFEQIYHNIHLTFTARI
ncbi:MAG: hypothetical protein JXA66_01310, partial [Oligoflexia bacterium]|nr:hypothetical protein [Oligoflexia bacterium]